MSKPDAIAEWLFNGKPIAEALDKDSYVITNVDGIHRLQIPKCSLKNQGNYSLRVPSENIETKARLGVDGKIIFEAKQNLHHFLTCRSWCRFC